MSRFTDFLIDTEDDYKYQFESTINEAGPVVETLLGILTHIVGVKKEVEGVINMVEDKQLKKYLKGFLTSCVLISTLLKSVTHNK